MDFLIWDAGIYNKDKKPRKQILLFAEQSYTFSWV